MDEEWIGFLGPEDFFRIPGQPIFHLISETFAAEYAEKHTDTIVWRGK